MATSIPQYAQRMRAGIPGFIASMVPRSLISRDVMDAGGIPFGVPVFQHATNPRGVTATPNDKFVGVTVIDRSARGQSPTEPDGYAQYESASIMASEGDVYVTALVAVAAGDPVFITEDGEFSNVAGTGGREIVALRWEDTTTGANQIARIRFGTQYVAAAPAAPEA